MDLETSAVTTLAQFFGGQGTINVNSWSPDSRQLAFVTYQNIPNPEEPGELSHAVS
jgi:TolB protein